MEGLRPVIVLTLLLAIGIIQSSSAQQKYIGKLLGKLSELHHGVSGEVYAVDARTLHIKDFTYDGEGPAAYFYVGSSRSPSNQKAFRVRDETGNEGVLKRYRRKSITLTLPEGKTLNNINWFSVWCDEFAVNFGDVKIPRNFDYPKPQKIGALRGVHGVSSDPIVIVDAQTILIPHFSYDGEAPDAKFWAGSGARPTPQGFRIPDENGKEVPLRRYASKTIVLTLPKGRTVFDIGHFGVWCEAFTVDFGHVTIPQGLNVPPSLQMLGVSPQSKLNCEVLYEDQAFEVRWAIAGDSIVLQLVAKIDDGDYMSFGLSGTDDHNQMIGGDVVVAWVDRETMRGNAVDYFLHAKSQCSGPSGSCPDENLADNSNNIRLLNAALVNGYSIVTYQRPLRPSDQFDRQIYTNQSQAVIWATGPLNQRGEVSFHTHYLKKDRFIEFGRPPKWNCPLPENNEETHQQEDTPPQIEHVETTTRGRDNEKRRGGNQEENERRRGSQNRRRPSQQQTSETVDEAIEERPSRRRGNTPRVAEVTTEKPRTPPTPKPVSKRDAWYIPPIECNEPDDGVFYAQMGPTGGKRGYPAITGHVGWGISWYINGLLIPVINVVRGRTYTFVVEGGHDPEIPARYHPFYITDDPVGGYAYKTEEERKNITIFSGARQTSDGEIIPTGYGRLCHWTHTGEKDADEFPSFGAFQRTLELRCDPGEPGIISWTPDKNTPDTVYYQCFSHRYLGWKINVLDSCDVQHQAQGSAPEPSLALPDDKNINGDLKSSPSIQIETRIKPNDLFQTQQTKQPAKTEDEVQNDDNKDIITTHQPDTQIITEKETDITDVILETDSKHENLTGVTTKNDSDISLTYPTRDKLLESQYKNPLEITAMLFPAGRLPLEPQFPNMRRPIHRPMNKPMYMRPPNPNFGNKKYYYRAPVRRGPVVRPIPIHPPNKIQAKFALSKDPILVPPPISHVNISSTITPIPTLATTTEQPKLKPAINTGFHPASIVIESGFVPIMSKEFEKRISEDVEETEDVGVIQTQPENTQNSQTITQSFEPIFIPSPLDNTSKKHNQSNKMTKRRFTITKKNPPNVVVIVKEGRSNDEIHSDDGDPMVMAAERIQSYYLPPDDNKPITKLRKQDTGLPPGQVVTYDGKTVSGTSLSAPVNGFEGRSSQTNLLRMSPQFGPFRGEKPPLNPSNVNIASIPQLGSSGSLNRGLSAPGSNTTRLSSVRNRRDVFELDSEDVRSGRYVRNAHHTPEHTAQQKRNLQKYSKKFVLQDVIQRARRSPHHTVENTAEQKRDSKKLAKKFVGNHEEIKIRKVRSPHHTHEHTQEQKRESRKIAKKVAQDNKPRITRSPHHTPEHTAQQKKDAAKQDTKKTKRSPHHTPEHTEEQKRKSEKISKKVIQHQEQNNKHRIARSPHHTPEHTQEQKRESVKIGKKVIQHQEQNNKLRIARSPHHTPEHTREQKRESVKIGKKVTQHQEQNDKHRIARSPHHTPEHTAQQKKDGVKQENTPDTKKTKRSPHHTPEHTQEQKRKSVKNGKKVIQHPEQNNKYRIARSPHHTPEHTAQQKKDATKSENKSQSVKSTYQHTAQHKRDSRKLLKTSGKRQKRDAHHTPEHTAQQMKEMDHEHDQKTMRGTGNKTQPFFILLISTIIIRLL